MCVCVDMHMHVNLTTCYLIKGSKLFLRIKIGKVSR